MKQYSMYFLLQGERWCKDNYIEAESSEDALVKESPELRKVANVKAELINHVFVTVPDGAENIMALTENREWVNALPGSVALAVSYQQWFKTTNGDVRVPIALVPKCNCIMYDCPKEMAIKKTEERFGCANVREG